MRTVYRHYRTYSNKRYQPHRDTILAHYRSGRGKNGKRLTTWEPLLRGGMTVCLIVNDNEVISMGVALCSPRDNFCYRVGRDKARDRAEKNEAIAWPSWAEDFVAVDGHGYTMFTGLSDNGVRTLMLHHRRLNQREGS